MSAIGILGGMGPQASTRLVELLIEKTSNYVANPKNSDYPEIIHLSVPVPDFISSKKDMETAKQMLIQKTKLLEQFGSTINCLACNTAHLLLPELSAVTTVSFVSLPELVTKKVREEGFKRVGLLATPSTLASNLYGDVVKPSKMIVRKLELLITKQLAGRITDGDRDNFKKLARSFISQNKLDAVILGCTELPLIYGDNNDPRIIDTLDVLSEELLTIYFQ